ncbi:MAG: O-antigen ligase family protein [Janthinobacterium lividum]
MQRSQFVGPAAMFWGLAVFAPVGVNYLAALLLLASLAAAGHLRERAARVRASPLWWPIVAYVGWTWLVLALAPHYPQTPSNLWHGMRIALTMLMALSLTRGEAIESVRGFLVIAFFGVAIVLLYRTVGFPLWAPWRATLEVEGNKSINNALLFALLGATGAVVGLAQFDRPGRRHLRLALGAFAVTAITGLIVTLWLISRTSLLALLLAVPAACVHQWRRQLRPLAVALLLGGAVAGAALWQSPAVQHKFELGVQELEAAQAGTVSEGSWVVRYYMYRDTARMVIDRPLAGWGIGGWTEQWRLRGPALLTNYNMPHNDFLWMGAQGGVPGALTLLAILLTGLWQCWKRADFAGRMGFVAIVVMIIATSVNSAMRDAQIGLSLLWVCFVYLRLALEPGSPWHGVPPQRLGAGRLPGPMALSGDAPPSLRP